MVEIPIFRPDTCVQVIQILINFCWDFYLILFTLKLCETHSKDTPEATILLNWNFQLLPPYGRGTRRKIYNFSHWNTNFPFKSSNISMIGMSTNIRTFEYSFDRLIFEYEIEIRILEYFFSKKVNGKFVAKYRYYLF
jgi:hypothetical protein